MVLPAPGPRCPGTWPLVVVPVAFLLAPWCDPPGPVVVAFRCPLDAPCVVVLWRVVPWSVSWRCLVGPEALVRLFLLGLLLGLIVGSDLWRRLSVCCLRLLGSGRIVVVLGLCRVFVLWRVVFWGVCWSCLYVPVVLVSLFLLGVPLGLTGGSARCCGFLVLWLRLLGPERFVVALGRPCVTVLFLIHLLAFVEHEPLVAVPHLSLLCFVTPYFLSP